MILVNLPGRKIPAEISGMAITMAEVLLGATWQGFLGNSLITLREKKLVA